MTVPTDGLNPSSEGNSRSGVRRRKRRNRSANKGQIPRQPTTEMEDTALSTSPDKGEAGPRHNTKPSPAFPAKAKRRRSRRPGRAERQPEKFESKTPSPRDRQDSATNKRASSGEHQASKTHQQRRFNSARQTLPLYAALDLGTNNCRLLVAVPQQVGRFRVVDAFSQIVRLGEGLEGSGRLADDAMDRAIGALRICASKLKRARVKRMRLIATEACRRAQNGEHFIERVRRETGLELEIVNRQTEAYLAAEGCGELVDRKAEGAVLFDIGGGSSELILIDKRHSKSRKISDHIRSWVSLPVGVVTLSERHGGQSVSRETFAAMVTQVEEMLAEFEGRDTLSRFWNNGKVHLLGTSGTVTTLAGVHLELPKYDRRMVDGTWLADGDVDNIIDQLLEMEFEQRAANPCIGRERADLVLAGCAILQAIRNTWPSPRLRVADRGLREGLLTQMMNQDGAWIKPKKGRRRRNHYSHKNAQNRG